ncbi:MAG: hypothetical protein KKF56_05605 [Nanoarchaeota archaeon]|nr:hypothetical protein [Nanoarchaeota archaeon]
MNPIKIDIPKFCLGKCNGLEYKCCRCGTRRFIIYQSGDGKRLHSLCRDCYKKPTANNKGENK